MVGKQSKRRTSECEFIMCAIWTMESSTEDDESVKRKALYSIYAFWLWQSSSWWFQKKLKCKVKTIPPSLQLIDVRFEFVIDRHYFTSQNYDGYRFANWLNLCTRYRGDCLLKCDVVLSQISCKLNTHSHTLTHTCTCICTERIKLCATNQP